MRINLQGALLLLCIYLFAPTLTSAQVNTGLNGQVINLLCNQTCVNIPVRIPHLKSTTDYTVNTIPYNPYAYTTPTGQEDLDLYRDDQYSNIISLPFAFCFYDSMYEKVVVGSNGLITFDETNATCDNSYTISNTIPFAGGTQCTQAGTYYPKASIMGIYTDLDPRPEAPPTAVTANASPADRKIEWRVEGVAPFRRFVVSFFHVGVFSTAGNGCSLATPNTFQIVLYESTGIIEVFIEQKNCNPSTSQNAILGIQNWDRDLAVAAPGKNRTVWNENNTGYRFTPTGDGPSRFRKSEVFTMAGAFIALGDTITTTTGLLDVTFPNFCPPGTSAQYVIKTTYASCENTAVEMVSSDTITINKTNSLNATATSTESSCGLTGSGTITATVPTGVGTAPYTFTLNPGATSQTGSPSTTFNGLTSNNYTVNVVDASGGCSSTVPVTVTNNGVLLITLDPLATSCTGANNGSITITAPNSTPPISYSVNAGPWTAGSVISPLPAGTYFISVQDNGGCQAVFVPVTIDEGATTVTGSAAPAPTTCAGANNGTITVTANGAGPHEYSINNGTNWQTSNVFTGLAAGTYSVIIRSGGVCTSNPISVTITAGAGLTATTATTSTTCPGVNNGSITVTPTTGTGPFTIIMDGTVTRTGNPSVTFTGVSTGTHTFTFTDANGCTSAAGISAVVAAGTGYVAAATSANTTCFGVNNGSITVTPALPGVSPYTFVLSPGAVSQTGAANTTFSNLAPGTYSVLVTDNVGCQATVSNISITTGAGLTANITSTQTTCAGVNNGTITVTPSAGTAPFTIVLDGATTQTGNPSTTFNGVSSGAHTIAITDANGCSTNGTLSTTVGAGTGYSATSTQVNVSCLGATNGSLTVTPQTPGTSPYTFVLTPGAVSQTGATNTTFNNLGAGSYSVLVTDAAGCQTTVNNITLAPGAGLTATMTPTATTCTGASNGSILVTPTNGTAPYTIVLDGTTTQTGNPATTFTGVTSGGHFITITDANGCTTSAPIAVPVTAGTGFTANFTAVPTACVGVNNGGVTITPQAPGSGPYTFVLNPGGITQTGATTTSFTGLAPATYSATVTDANGCQTSLSNMVVTQGSGIQANLTPTNVACFGTSTGSILVTPSNGTGPYTFVLNGTTTQTGAANTTFNNLAANTYSITITDAAGCVSPAAFSQVITQPVALTAATPAALPVTCNGGNNGQISVTPSGGIAPYTYSLNAGPFQPSNTFTVSQGSYTIRVRDSRGCELAFSNISVTQPAALSGSINGTTNATCSGGPDGTIQVVATGGTPPFQYSANTATNTYPYQGTSTLNVVQGTYTVTIRDANNCTATIPNVIVGLTDNLTVNIATPPPVCEGTSTPLVVTSNAASYAWTPAPGLSNLSSPGPSVSPVVPTTYTVTATLGNCTRTASVDVDVLPAPVPDAGAPGDICYGQDYQLTGSGGDSYTWSPVTYLDDYHSQYPNVINPEKPITYTLSVVGANGCSSIVTDKVFVNVTPPLRIAVSPLDTIVHEGAQFNILATSQANTLFEWTPAFGLNDPTLPNPTVTAPVVGSVLTYQVRAYTSGGCESAPATVIIRVYKGPEIYVPNAFSPNGDGLNETFYPVPVGIKKLHYFRVYNRWGQLLYGTTTFNQAWDGKMGGKEQGNDVYVWMVEGTTETGEIIRKRGTVTLVR